MDLINRIKSHLQQMAPHVKACESPVLLKEALAELEKHEWISVEDRLPENCNHVRIFPTLQFHETCDSAEYLIDEKRWRCEFHNGYDYEYFYPENITHWRPILEDDPVVKTSRG